MGVVQSPEPPHNDGGFGARKAQQRRSGDDLRSLASDPLEYLKTVYDHGRQWRETTTQSDWHKSYRAFHNRHFDGSKYLSPRFKGRSRLFRPKTRTAVLKNMALVRQALFSTVSPVSLEAEYDDDPVANAGAKVLQSLLTLYLDRASAFSGFPWFLVAMGARQTSDITGVCISKQSWRSEKEMTEYRETFVNAAGLEEERIVTEEAVLADHLDCELVPPENVVIDPGANWLDPIQSAQYACFTWPWNREDLINEIETGRGGPGARWRAEALAVIEGSSKGEHDASATRRSRSGANDRYSDASAAGTGADTVWVQECFVRIGGVDLQFLATKGATQYLTDPIPVEEAYPEQNGKRPYVMGYGAIEAFNLFPWSNIAGLQQLQHELNDIANMQIDAVRESVTPTRKVRRGKRVDLKQIEQAYPGSSIMLDDLDDVMWDRAPGPPSSVYQQSNLLNADFDDAAGLFNAGTVQTSRSLNETVGGMQLMSGAANTLSEFFLAVWIETWVEPAMRQMVNAISYYVSDERIIALAGKKAALWKKFQQAIVSEEMLTADVSLRVNAGVGTQDPLMKMQKLNGAFDMLGKVLGPEARIALEIEDLVEEVMGAAGYRDGMRFINVEILQQLQKSMQQKMQSGGEPDPRLKVAELKAEIDKLKIKADAHDSEADRRHETELALMELDARSFPQAVR